MDTTHRDLWNEAETCYKEILKWNLKLLDVRERCKHQNYGPVSYETRPGTIIEGAIVCKICGKLLSLPEHEYEQEPELKYDTTESTISGYNNAQK